MRIWIAIWVGSSQLSGVIVRWIAGGVLLKLTLVVLGALFIKGLPWTTRILIALAVAWLGCSIVLGLRAPGPAVPASAPTDTDEEQEEPAEHPTAALTTDQLADHLRGLLGKTGGVHLTTLAQALPGPRLPTRDVRALLAAAGIRVRPGVRAPGEGVREGVHRDDIPAPSSPTTEATPGAVVAAGQGGNNNSNNTEQSAGEKGFVLEDDPDNPARTHVRWARR